MYGRIVCRCVECKCVVMVYSSVIIYLVFDDAIIFGWFVSCCFGPFGGLCRRRLIVVLVECAYVTPSVIARSVVGGL